MSAETTESSLLVQRQFDWPNWRLPGPFKKIDLDHDLMYPEWMKGDWHVLSIDLDATKEKTISHFAHFNYDDISGKVIGDRKFNSESLGKEILGNKLIRVELDPKSPNRQLALFQGETFLETKIIGRNQEMNGTKVFLTDELALQIFHLLSSTRISQVETLTRYQECKDDFSEAKLIPENSICAEQWQAQYPTPEETLRPKPKNLNHFLLLFIPQIENFPIDLAKQITFLERDYHLNQDNLSPRD